MTGETLLMLLFKAFLVVVLIGIVAVAVGTFMSFVSVSVAGSHAFIGAHGTVDDHVVIDTPFMSSSYSGYGVGSWLFTAATVGIAWSIASVIFGLYKMIIGLLA